MRRLLMPILFGSAFVSHPGAAEASVLGFELSATVTSITAPAGQGAADEFNAGTGLTVDLFDPGDMFELLLFLDLDLSGVDNSTATEANPSDFSFPLSPAFLESFVVAGGVSVSPNHFPGAASKTTSPDADQMINVSPGAFSVFNDFDAGLEFDLNYAVFGDFGLVSLADLETLTQADLNSFTMGNGILQYQTSDGLIEVAYDITDIAFADISTIPVPPSLALLLAGWGLLGVVFRRRV